MLHRSTVRLLFFVLSVLLLPTASLEADEAATDGLTAGELAAIDQGGVVIKTDTYPTGNGARGARVNGYCIINTLPDVAWSIMLDYHKFDQFMPRLEKVEVLEQTPRTMKVTETVRVPLGVISYTVDLTFRPEQRTASWMLDKSRKKRPGGDLRQLGVPPVRPGQNSASIHHDLGQRLLCSQIPGRTSAQEQSLGCAVEPEAARRIQRDVDKDRVDAIILCFRDTLYPQYLDSIPGYAFPRTPSRGTPPQRRHRRPGEPSNSSPP